MKRLPVLVALLALAGCATGVKSTLPGASASPDFVGAASPAVPAGMQEPEMARVQAALEGLGQREWGIPLQVVRTPESFVQVRLGADESFEARTAQLQPGALVLLSKIAEVLKTAPDVVTHVLVYGADPAGEVAVGLSARRAASVQSYLLNLKLPATRVRAEGRVAQPRVELVIRPVVAGREAEAWMPPAAAANP